jgi:hypothetical protein
VTSCPCVNHRRGALCASVKRAKLFSVGAVLAVLPMTCRPATDAPSQRQAPTWAPAVRIPYPDRCAVLQPIDLPVYPLVTPDLVTWYRADTGGVFGYSHTETSKIYKTRECLERSPD